MAKALQAFCAVHTALQKRLLASMVLLTPADVQAQQQALAAAMDTVLQRILDSDPEPARTSTSTLLVSKQTQSDTPVSART
jgi:hypothetical protein